MDTTPQPDPARSKDVTFTLVGHAHVDPVWLWDWREGVETVKATFRSALDRMAENPDLVFAHSSAAQYEWIEAFPGLVEEVREAVRQGRWEPVGGWWVEPDVNLAGGESLARQALIGQRTLERVAGRRARVAFLPDSFGHPGTLPQLFRLSGLDSFVFMRPGANELELPSNLFWWEGPDGSRVLAARIEAYNSNPVHVDSSLERNIRFRPHDAPEWLHLYGVGNHGGGPTRKSIESIRRAAANPDFPGIALGSMEGFFERARGREHPTVRFELQHHARGCYSAHHETKRLNRRSEHALVAAETWCAIAALHGREYPREALERAWKRMLFNQFHDILAGSSIEAAYEDSRDDYGEALSIAGRAEFGARQYLASLVDTRRDGREPEEVIRRTRWTFNSWTADLGDGVPVLAWNPTGEARREVVEVELNDWMSEEIRVLDAAGNEVSHQLVQPESVNGGRPRLAFVAEVPALGHALYRAVDEPAAALPAGANPLAASATVLENRRWRLEFDAGSGTLRSLVDRERGLELLAGAGAQLIVVEDGTDTWGHGLSSLRRVVGAFRATGATLLENGPVRATVALDLEFGVSTARHEITLYRDTDQITARLEVDWREPHRALKLAFPWALSDATATFEVPYGHAVRAADGQEEPVQRWLDVTGRARDARGVAHPCGVSILNDTVGGADALGPEARLTLLRSPVFAHHDPARLEPGVRYAVQDLGRHRFRWALVPHAGDWGAARVPARALEFNQPLAVMREYAHGGDLPPAHAYATLEADGGAVLSALKTAEDGDGLVARLFEAHGRPARARLGVGGATLEAELGANQVAGFRLRPGKPAEAVNFLEEEA